MLLKKYIPIKLHVQIRAATSGRVTASHPNSEVKLPRVSVVLRWGTTREGDMLHVIFCLEISQVLLLSEQCFELQIDSVDPR
jgi:hypothetical protein